MTTPHPLDRVPDDGTVAEEPPAERPPATRAERRAALVHRIREANAETLERLKDL
ncbi:hypothetical protein ABTX81_18480 [Kitasatospora sp. NPDC097605]|uniref:hypothetical protein n=1 Tax=Kitasatospora sp. NPDC097605 TaxID=3157226 RepID=UPI00332FE956